MCWSQFLLDLVQTDAGLPLAVHVWLASQMHDGVEEQSNRRLTRLDTFGQSQGLLHVLADCIKAVLKRLVTVLFLPPAGVVTTVMLVTALGHGWDSYVKMESKQRRSTAVGWRGSVAGPGGWYISVGALISAQAVVASEQVQGGVQVRVDLVDPVPDGLQSRPPVRRLRSLTRTPTRTRTRTMSRLTRTHREEEEEEEEAPLTAQQHADRPC